MRTSTFIRLAFTAAAATACGPVLGCSELYNETRPSADAVFTEARAREVLDRVKAIEEALPFLACGPELRALFHDIRTECNSSQATLQSAFTPDGAPKAERGEANICQTKKIDGRVTTAERDLGLDLKKGVTMGVHLLTILRHEVVYVGANGKISSRQEERLRALAEERRLPSTRFLLMAAGLDGEVRAKTVTDRLQFYGVPQKEKVVEGGVERNVDRFERPWNYKLALSSAQIKGVDRPLAPEPKDIDRAVFVFRTECQ